MANDTTRVWREPETSIATAVPDLHMQVAHAKGLLSLMSAVFGLVLGINLIPSLSGAPPMWETSLGAWRLGLTVSGVVFAALLSIWSAQDAIAHRRAARIA